jgi:hypothetical protein
MSQSLRLSEKWFRRGLWLVAFVFAGFLIGLGSAVGGDLPKVEPQVHTNDFIEKPQSEPLRTSIKAAERAQHDAQDALDQAELKLRTAQADTAAAREALAIGLLHAVPRSEVNKIQKSSPVRAISIV